MQSHDLARLLLSLPDTPVATHANNHTCAPTPGYERITVGRFNDGRGDYLLIGNFSRDSMNRFNMRVREVYRE